MKAANGDLRQSLGWHKMTPGRACLPGAVPVIG